MSVELMEALRGQGVGPISPAIQLRRLLQYGQVRSWTFDTAWKWSYQRIKMPHDTSHRREYKAVLGESFDDPRSEPVRQREAWRRAYDGVAPTDRERALASLFSRAG